MQIYNIYIYIIYSSVAFTCTLAQVECCFICIIYTSHLKDVGTCAAYRLKHFCRMTFIMPRNPCCSISQSRWTKKKLTIVIFILFMILFFKYKYSY